MTRYLLDTDTLIDLSKGREAVRRQVLTWMGGQDELGVCAINVTEFYSGLLPAERAPWAQWFALLEYWHATQSAARQAGIWRYDFARRGIRLPTTDTMVAAVARERGAIIVTDNLKDYPMGGVQLLSLRG